MRACAAYTPLRKRADFQRIHTQGRRKGDTLLQVRILLRPAAEPSSVPLRLGMLVSKKFGSAVERNRFKRLVRAALCHLVGQLAPGMDLLVLPREAHAATMPAVLASLHSLLGALGVMREPGETAEEGATA